MADVTVTKPTLTYFNLAGRAELPRVLLEEAGVDYDFVTLTSWSEVKPAYIAAGKAPFGQVPIYEEPGLTLVQSAAIARYLAKKHGFAGANEHEAALIDQAAEGVNDTYERLIQVAFRTPEDQRPAAIEKFNAEFLPAQLGHFAKLLEKNGSNGFLVGSKLSYADLFLWIALSGAAKRVPGSDQVVDKNAAIKAFLDGVVARDRIKAYLARDVYAPKQ